MSTGNGNRPDPGSALKEPIPRPRFRSHPAPIKSSLDAITSRQDIFRAKLVFYLFLVSLGVFFAATMVSYAVIRTQSFQPIQREYLSLEIPFSFWISTLLLVMVSVFLQRGVWLVKRERQYEFRRSMVFAWVGAIVFLAIQYSGMIQLLTVHFSGIQGSAKVFGLCFTLALLHALHVVGGVAFLGFIIWQGFRNRYDHERHYAVEHCASYWHFLDCVWVAMLLTFVIMR